MCNDIFIDILEIGYHQMHDNSFLKENYRICYVSHENNNSANYNIFSICYEQKNSFSVFLISSTFLCSSRRNVDNIRQLGYTIAENSSKRSLSRLKM